MARNDSTDYQRPRYRRGPHPLVTVSMWLGIAGVFFVALYFGFQWLKKHDPTVLGQTANLEKPLVRIFYLDLHQRYLDNSTTANQRYTGKVVEVENKGNEGWGKYSRVEKRDGETAVLCFDIGKNGGPSESPIVLCLFPTRNEKQVDHLGKQWIIRGRVSSFDADSSVVVLEECEVVPH